ncbi:MAG TPA: ATP-binding protein [Leadbetterella sp.]|nr:ATP-binding protein [Leadbetterella sp.]
MKIIGRQPEQDRIREIMNNDKPAFVALYGRRRVGKTFLIKEYFNQKFTFYATGLANSNTQKQLLNFTLFINNQFSASYEPPKSWLECFSFLQKELSKIEGEKILFLDELPWFDTKKSDFMTGLDFFWNSWASSQSGLKLFVCGSAASWMINKLIRNKGGLYNRITHRFKIEPFTLAETETLFKSQGINLDRYQIINIYMTIGGIPFYLEQVQKGLSAAQNIEKICFSPSGQLRNEFQFVFSSLFNNSEKHEKLLRAVFLLGNRATRDQIIKYLGLESSGDFSLKLNELEESGFLKSYVPIGKNKSKKIYVIADYYTLFYFKFIEHSAKYAEGVWTSMVDSGTMNAWAGLAFEQVCWDHTANIKRKLGIEGIYSETSTWSKSADAEIGGTQIDLVIDRKDRIINLFEIKYSTSPFTITKEYDLKLRTKQSIFKEVTKTRKSVFLAMITTYGITPNEYAKSIIQNELTMDDLF